MQQEYRSRVSEIVAAPDAFAPSALSGGAEVSDTGERVESFSVVVSRQAALSA